MEIQYLRDGKIAKVDGYVFNKDEKTGYYLATKPINGRRVRLHVYMWEKHNGKIPNGYEIHHVTMDKSKNEIGDLALLSAEEHRRLHACNITEERKEQMRKNLLENAIPKAAEWHRSLEGREWHKQHGREAWKNRKPIKYICTNCGKEFESLKVYSDNENRFCHNNCKSAWRRKSGVDNEQRNCEICGDQFITDKYSKRTRCEKCRHIKCA